MATRPDGQTPDLIPREAAAVKTLEELARLLRVLRRREARRREGTPLTYRDLATKAGWSHAMVATYLTGKTLPPIDRFDTLIQLLGATAAEQGALATARDRVEEGRSRVLPEPRRPGASLPTPRQLPADVLGFIGRTAELGALDHALEAARRTSTVAVAAVTGTAGVGKTALAVHWAHRVKDQFPDGNLYADLHGYGPGSRADPGRVLAGFLTALDVAPGKIPADLDAKAALYRSLLDERRMLVVVDNAATPLQVRPLLPGSPGCLVVVTSRSMLTGLAARNRAHRIRLDLLPVDQAVALLAEFAGTDRVAAEPAAAQEITRWCARLPVALCVAGERAASSPSIELGELARRLRATERRLDLLEAEDDPKTAVRAVFSWSYDALPAAVARTFRLLGLHPGRDIDPSAVAALTGGDLDETTRALEVLVRAHLVEQSGPGRYRMHDLLRTYAMERTSREDGDSVRQVALTRLFDHYLGAAAYAMDTLFPYERHHRPRVTRPDTPIPVLSEPASAQAWLDAERLNLIAAATYAADHGWPTHCGRLAETLWRYLFTAAHYTDALTLYGDAVRAAHDAGDRTAEGLALLRFGNIQLMMGRTQQAHDRLQRALTSFRETGYRLGEGMALGVLGVICRVWQRYVEARNHLQPALAIFRDSGDLFGEGRTLGVLGEIYAQWGRHAEARDYLQQAAVLLREIGDLRGEGMAESSLGELLAKRGHHSEAQHRLYRALTTFRNLGDRHLQARTLNNVGESLRETGCIDAALARHRSALALANEIGEPQEKARAHDNIAQILRMAGHLDDARRHWHVALAIYLEFNLPEPDHIRVQLATLPKQAP